MIPELVSGISIGFAFLNGGAAYLLYRQYVSLAGVSLEFAAMIAESIKEQEDGSITMDPMFLAGLSMDHMSELGGLVKWIRG